MHSYESDVREELPKKRKIEPLQKSAHSSVYYHIAVWEFFFVEFAVLVYSAISNLKETEKISFR